MIEIKSCVTEKVIYVYGGDSLRNAVGYNRFTTTSLYILLEQIDPIRAYKVVNRGGEGVFTGGVVYEVDKEIIDDNFDEDEHELCGAGINLATLDWCLSIYNKDYKILVIEFNKLTKAGRNNIVIPIASDGKFRVKECRVVRELSLKELGLEE